MIFEDMGRIINFHKVKDIKWFENVICLLKSKYTIINENQLIGYYYNKKPLPRKSCMITVDDGDMTSYTIIYPILKKHHVPAIFFVSPEKMVQSGKHRNFWFQEARHCDDSNALMEKIHSGNYPIDDIWGMIDSYQQEHNTEILHDQNMTLEEVKAAIIKRDEIDRNKKEGALRRAEDAFYIDTSDLTIDKVCEIILSKIQK